MVPLPLLSHPPLGLTRLVLPSLNMNAESLWAAARTGPQEPYLSLVLLSAEVSASELPPSEPPSCPLDINLS